MTKRIFSKQLSGRKDSNNGSEPWFDGCEICGAEKKARTEGRSLTALELRAVFQKANRKKK